MARVLVVFPEPEDPRAPKGAYRRAWWRTLKESFGGFTGRVGVRPVILLGLGVMIYHWGLPHLLFNYRYTSVGSARIYSDCQYIGPMPFVVNGGDCPLIRWVSWNKLAL